jgi:hypothetical protein
LRCFVALDGDCPDVDRFADAFPDDDGVSDVLGLTAVERLVSWACRHYAGCLRCQTYAGQRPASERWRRLGPKEWRRISHPNAEDTS